jgi:hypothetical protein
MMHALQITLTCAQVINFLFQNALPCPYDVRHVPAATDGTGISQGIEIMEDHRGFSGIGGDHPCPPG